MKKLHNIFYHKLYLLPVVLFALGVFVNSYAKSVKVDANLIAKKIANSRNNFELSQVDGTLELYKNSQQRFLQHVVDKVQFQEKLKSELLSRMTPGNLVSAFMRELNRASVQKNSALKIRSALSSFKKANVEDADGGIGGRVTVDGAAPVQSVQVLAFDDHGYFAGSSDVNGQGNYTITGLNGGDYYVLTWSRDYVDEIYQNIQAPLGSFSGWRDAQLVKVFDAITEGIDFDLQKGAVLSGTIFKDDGTKIQDETVTFIVTKADNPRVIFTNQVVVADGRYELVVPQKGNVKISATVAGYLPTWQENKVDWATAATVNIPDYEAQVSDINFTLQPDPAAAELGNITGRISPDQPSVYFVYPAVVAAYNAADTSLATWAIQVSPLLGYQLTSLEPGDYLVYANDYLGDIIGTDNFRGKFYEENGNTLVSVSAGQTVENINVKLPAGATISGKVTDAGGSPVDSLMLIALNANTSLSGDDPFLTQFELSITATNDQGEYVFTGLPDGEYVLRTLSNYYINFDLNDLDNILVEGKHFGEVVDEYYNGVYNLLQWNDADRVVVQNLENVENVDFNLTQPRFFTGTVTDAQTGAPVRAVSLIAVNDTSAYPFWPFAKIEDNGEYSLGPLPQGKYKILALTGFGRDEGYLSEFYDGKILFSEANVLNLSASEMSNIDFALKKGAVIEGFVDLAPGDAVHWAGKDTLDGIPVVAFEAATGKVASYDFVQFNGGYRIEKLFPGSYKVMTLPIPSPYAASYFGGGASFDDASSETINVNFGDTFPADIELQKAGGSISGVVMDSLAGTPLASVLVIAYTSSGHAAGFALTGTDLKTGLPSSDAGTYRIQGLRGGQYFVRTFALSSALGVIGQITAFGDMVSNPDDALQLLGGGIDLDLNLNTFADKWYSDQVAKTDINLNELLFNASSYGVPSEWDNALFPIYAPVPFFNPVPENTNAVSVAEGAAVKGIDFQLVAGGVDDIVNDVAKKLSSIPDNFVVQQNYPNPFNPDTRITYSLPRNSFVSIKVFNELGRRVRSLVSQNMPAGEHNVAWNGIDENGRSVSAGIYFARVKAMGEVKMIKMLYVK